MFRGSCPARMDDKSRLKMPSIFRRALEVHFPGNEFFVTSVDGEYARIYPIRLWVEIEEGIRPRSDEEEAKRCFLEAVSYYGQEQQMDTQGRLLLHSPLRVEADLQGEVIVLGMLNHLAVWNAERFRRRRSETPYSQEHAKLLSGLLR